MQTINAIHGVKSPQLSKVNHKKTTTRAFCGVRYSFHGLNKPNSRALLQKLELLSKSSYYFPLSYTDIFSIGLSQSGFNGNNTIIWVDTFFCTLRTTIKAKYHIIKKNSVFSTKGFLAILYPSIEKRAGYYSNWASSRSIVAAHILYSIFALTKNFTLAGYNYSAVYSEGLIGLSLGYSHTFYYKIPYGVFIKIYNKKNIQLYGLNYVLMTRAASLFGLIQKPNAFSGKGLLQDYKNPTLKKRSGQ